MPNPALNDNIFQRETAANPPPGSFSPGWGAPGGAAASPAAFGTPGPTAPAPGTTWGGAPGGPAGPGFGADAGTMRISGTMSAAAILLLLLSVAGWFGWQAVKVTTFVNAAGHTEVATTKIPAWLFASWIVGFALALVTIFRPKAARISAPLYAVAEGLLVGAISHLYEVQFKGIVLQAVGLTIGVFVMMLVLYGTGTIKVTDRLRRGIFAATGAVFLVYMFDLVLRLFGTSVPMIHQTGAMGIGFSVVVVAIASFNLLLDFDLIDRGVRMGAPRYMEWYGAFSLMVTLIWLYLEILRLLAKLRQR